MTKAFQVELKKARHRHDLLLCLLVPVLMIIWVGGLSPSSPEELANGYSALFYSVPVINTIILPVMMSLLSSRLWDMEVKGNTTKLLYTLQSRRSLFMGKALFGILEILLITTLEMGSVVFTWKNPWIYGSISCRPVSLYDSVYPGSEPDAFLLGISSYVNIWESGAGALRWNCGRIGGTVFCIYAADC